MAKDVPLVELRGIRKVYPRNVALDGVDLVLHSGEIRALLGENGAGKSTLMGILYGLVRPDAGEIHIDGKRLSVRSPREALGLGIGLVQQHFALAPALTVAENIELAAITGWGQRPGGTLGWLARLVRAFPRRFDRAAAADRTRELAARTGLEVDPGARVGDLPLGVRQRVEILKALRLDARVLLLDEPTSVLTPAETDELFSVLRRLRDEQRAIVIITHKLKDVERVADRVTVLRRGRVVAGDLPARETGASELASLMTGEGGASLPVASSSTSPQGPPVLEIVGATVLSERDGPPRLERASLDVRKGEVLGIAGVAGNGQDELFALASGLRVPDLGSLRLLGRPRDRADPRAFVEAGVAAIPAERLELALASTHTCAENLALKDLALGRRFTRLGLIDTRAVSREARAALERNDVRPRDPERLAGELSGGNQQKIVLARELAGQPTLVVAFDPTRGLDVKAAAFVWNEIHTVRLRGAAVLLIATDLDELLAHATRVLALHAGRVLAPSSPRPDRAELGLLMLRGAPAGAKPGG